MLAAGAALLVFAAFAAAPVAQPMSLGLVSLVESRAPWFFLWVQQLLKLGDPFVFGVLAPLTLLGILAAIPYVLPAPRESELGRWFPRGGRLAQMLVILLTVSVIVLTILALVKIP